MVHALGEMKEKTLRYCPEKVSILGNIPLLSFMDRLNNEFPTLGLEKRLTAKGLFHGIDFCYLHPIVFWTRTGFSFPKRMEDELFADFYLENDEFKFEAHAPYSEDDDEEDFKNKDQDKTWPLSALDTPDILLNDVLAEFKSFYRKYRASQNW